MSTIYKDLTTILPNKTCIIYQKEWTVIDSSNPKSILMTYGVAPCVAITIFYEDVESKVSKAALIHFDDNIQHESLPKIIKKFQDLGIDAKDLQVNLLGGWEHHYESSKMANFVKDFFVNAGCDVNTEKLFAKPNSSNLGFIAIGIDSKTGEIILYERSSYGNDEMQKLFEYYTIEQDNAYKARIDIIDSLYLQNDNIAFSGTPLFYSCECYPEDSKNYNECMKLGLSYTIQDEL